MRACGQTSAKPVMHFYAGKRCKFTPALTVEYGDYKVEAKNVKELEAAIKLLPPPSQSQVLEDGERVVNGEILPTEKS